MRKLLVRDRVGSSLYPRLLMGIHLPPRHVVTCD